MKKYLLVFLIVYLTMAGCYNGSMKTNDESIFDIVIDESSMEDLIKNTANNIRVAIIDTGVNNSHPSLKDSKIQNYSVDKYSNIMIDSHGTQMAGILASKPSENNYVKGIIPGIQIVSIQVGEKNDISLGNLAKGIYKAIELEVDIISISISTYKDSEIVRDAVEEAIRKNISVVASVGNDYYGGKSFPACYSNVLAVTGLTRELEVLPYANSNNIEAVAAIADNVETISDKYDQTRTLSGTSVAVPTVVGLVSIIKSENKLLKPTEINNIIRFTAKDLGVNGPDIYFGYGLVDFYKALRTPRLCVELQDNPKNKTNFIIKVQNFKGELLDNINSKVHLIIKYSDSDEILYEKVIKIEKGELMLSINSIFNDATIELIALDQNLVPYKSNLDILNMKYRY